MYPIATADSYSEPNIQEGNIKALVVDGALVFCDNLDVVRTKGICGGRARIVGTRVPVWGIESKRRAGYTAAAIIKMHDGLTARHVQSAIAYAKTHQHEINSAIKENEDA
jgi:uncharacterized protein (DUF433 family)